ncbi:MAG: hypothetical protein ACI867_002184 [Glaciecola sp.]
MANLDGMNHTRRPLTTALAFLALAGPGLGAVAFGGQPSTPSQSGLVEVFAADGTMAWARVELPSTPLSDAETARFAQGQVHTLHESGPSDNRFDLVIVGDGYTAQEQELFHAHARAKMAAIAGIEPFTTYLDFVNIWMVDVVSTESGVDNDPFPGAPVDTALDMEFWCQGIERLLCVDQGKATAAAAAAPEVDHVLVLANSTKYGGAGGLVATSSGDNPASDLVTIHELGHSIAGLADEYEYYARAGLSDDSTEDVTIPAPGLSGLPGQEPSGVNITAASSDEAMAAEELKWFRWLGADSPDGGKVGQFEGGGYSPAFIYRPTQDSLMHTLGIAEGGNVFNVVAIEQFVAKFHQFVEVVTDASPRDNGKGARKLAIEVEDLGAVAFEVRWFLDGVEVLSSRGKTSFVVTPPIAAATASVTVEVSDTTAWVRDPALIAEHLTETRSWSV